MIDIDSFTGEVHGDHKQGASCGYPCQLGYHPILAVRSDTGEVLHIRNRRARPTRRVKIGATVRPLDVFQTY